MPYKFLQSTHVVMDFSVLFRWPLGTYQNDEEQDLSRHKSQFYSIEHTTLTKPYLSPSS